MNTDRWQRIKKLFIATLQRKPKERPAYLQEVCHEDRSLREEIESLLRAHDESQDFLELPTDAGLLLDPDEERLPAERIGQYLLQRVISSGGMGTVYEALQENPQRTVAIKVMREGATSRSALRRFEYESEILARLEHPNIAQVIEAGTFRREKESTPYFVMEYIPEARHITEYAHAMGLSLTERLELFLPICDAVHHGHQKGIIHRDLKPSNLLVDASEKVKVIDFGVARVTDSDLRLTTAQTDVGQLVGTVQYMSPEQCRADPYDLDVRSDVYALGVVLYEVLCGKLPYDIRRAAVFEATRVIREDQPDKPSTTNRALRGEVETIVLKALEKERRRRYQTVSDLGADIRRFLDGKVILARPAGPATKLWKKVKRNPVLSSAVLVAVMAVIMLLVYIPFISYPRLKHERDRVEAERTKAVEARKEAEEEAENTRTINAFLQEMLSMADPYKEGGGVDVREMLDRAAERIDREFPDRPEIEAQLRSTLGVTYRNNGLFDPAAAQLRAALELRLRALGREDPITLSAMNSLAVVLTDQGKYREAEKMHLEALRMRSHRLGEDHPDTLASMQNLAVALMKQGRYPEAEAILRKVIELRSLVMGETHPSTLAAMVNLATVLMKRGELFEAEEMHRKVLEVRRQTLGKDHLVTMFSMSHVANLLRVRGEYSEAESMLHEIREIRLHVLGDEHPGTLATMNDLANVYRDRGEYLEAESIFREVLKRQTRSLGKEHPLTCNTMNYLANVLSQQGDYSGAEELHRTVLELRTRLLTGEHPDVLQSMNNLAVTLKAQDRYAEAESMHRKTLELRIRVLGENHLETVTSMSNLGNLLNEQGRYAEAESMHRKALEIRNRVLRKEHPDVLQSMNNLANTLKEQGAFSEAESIHRDVLDIRAGVLGTEHPETLGTLNNLANVLMRQGEYAEAEEILRKTLEIQARTIGREHPDALHTLNNLGIALKEQAKYVEAESILLEVLEFQRRTRGENQLETLAAMNNLANVIRNQGKYSEAEPILKQGIGIAKRRFPGGHPLKSMLHVSYGVCLYNMARYQEAEGHLLDGYRGYKTLLGEKHQRTQYALGLLVEFYEAWGEPEKAAALQKIVE